MVQNKKTAFTVLALSSVLALGACGEDEQVTQPVNNESTGETKTSPADASPSGGLDEGSIGGETYGFTEFSVDVDMPDQNDAIDISYEEDRDQVEAAYENQLDGVNLAGDEAFNEMEQSLGQLNLASDTPDDEVITQVVEAFGIDPGYSKIEIEVSYADGSEKDYEQVNE